MRHSILFALVALALVAGAALADGIVFPKDPGVLNVKDYGAKGDGRHDDTAAIQKALSAYPDGRRIVYLPNGVYRITDTLIWPLPAAGGPDERARILQGQSREKTFLKVADGCAGFGNPKNAKSVIQTGQGPAQGLRIAVRDVTIDTGKKNPGAIGLRFMANKQGWVRDVTIRAGEGKGQIGLDLDSTDANGSLFVKNVRVVGFDYGVRAAKLMNSLTIETLSLQDQNKYGLVNEGACLSIRSLESRNVVPAVLNSGNAGVVTLIDATMVTGRGTVAKPAVFNEAFLYARNVSSVGYAETIRNAANDERPDPGSKVAEFVSHRPLGASSGAKAIAVKDPQPVPWDDLQDWVSPTAFGAKPDDDKDDSEAIQKAIDSGKSTVYFPSGSYVVRRTILIRGKVRRVLGCESTVTAVEMKLDPIFRVVNGATPLVVIEQLSGHDSETPTFDNASSRTLVVKDCDHVSGRFTGSGELFLENVSSSSLCDWRFGTQKVWARQLCVSSEGRHVLNNGGSVWILGFTAERGGTLIETRSAGRTEVRGGLCRTTIDPKDAPMFLVDGGSLAVTLGESCVTGKPYELLVKAQTTEARRGQVPSRAGGSVLPLWSGK